MNRRGFLGLLGSAVGAMALDPERLLWAPGKKLISIPRIPARKMSLVKYAIGDTIMVRKPYRFAGGNGLSFQPEPIVDDSIPMVIRCSEDITRANLMVLDALLDKASQFGYSSRVIS